MAHNPLLVRELTQCCNYASAVDAHLKIGKDQNYSAVLHVLGFTISGLSTNTTHGNSWMCLIKVLIVTSLGKITEFIALIGGDDNSIYFMVSGDAER